MEFARSVTSFSRGFHLIERLTRWKGDIRMNSPETKAMSAASMNNPVDLGALNDGMAEREFAERVETNQHRLRSELEFGTK